MITGYDSGASNGRLVVKEWLFLSVLLSTLAPKWRPGKVNEVLRWRRECEEMEGRRGVAGIVCIFVATAPSSKVRFDLSVFCKGRLPVFALALQTQNATDLYTDPLECKLVNCISTCS